MLDATLERARNRRDTHGDTFFIQGKETLRYIRQRPHHIKREVSVFFDGKREEKKSIKAAVEALSTNRRCKEHGK
ncbi:hypothetical protein EBO34_03065 [Alteribacter keqinensis]|uniref:Uncharacterized protein n=1 Tax=Alteribacter keqinensis TaxID=2483800 RepID=A0A3M7TTJ7_9BACI|nr:hypothetical protein EBO34_03065 [Alteribacter keqinensis]